MPLNVSLLDVSRQHDKVLFKAHGLKAFTSDKWYNGVIADMTYSQAIVEVQDDLGDTRRVHFDVNTFRDAMCKYVLDITQERLLDRFAKAKASLQKEAERQYYNTLEEISAIKFPAGYICSN